MNFPEFTELLKQITVNLADSALTVGSRRFRNKL
jgi:hypothetical protein